MAAQSLRNPQAVKQGPFVGTHSATGGGANINNSFHPAASGKHILNASKPMPGKGRNVPVGGSTPRKKG